MKSARPSSKAESSAPGEGALIIAASLPIRVNTACAEVLARMLSGEVMTAADTLDRAATMRAAAHAHYLTHHYGWPVVSEERAVGCADGRVVTVACYRLAQETIAAARAAGAVRWMADVRRARSALRATVAQGLRRAEAINRARGHKVHPGQCDLFGGAPL